MAENKVIFLIDFDVTISRKDSTDTLLETHNPEYKKIIRERYRNCHIWAGIVKYNEGRIYRNP